MACKQDERKKVYQSNYVQNVEPEGEDRAAPMSLAMVVDAGAFDAARSCRHTRSIRGSRASVVWRRPGSSSAELPSAIFLL